MFAESLPVAVECLEMIATHTILQAAQILQRASPAGSRVVLFGSHATGTAGERSDVDFMVVEPEVKGWLRETDRLYRAVRPLRLPIDLIVTTEALFNRHKDVQGTVYHEAHRVGVVFNAVA